jgi:hypothetical protein
MKKNYLSMLCAFISLALFVIFRSGAAAQIDYDDNRYSTVYLGHVFTLSRSLELAAAVILALLAIWLYRISPVTKKSK